MIYNLHFSLLTVMNLKKGFTLKFGVINKLKQLCFAIWILFWKIMKSNKAISEEQYKLRHKTKSVIKPKRHDKNVNYKSYQKQIILSCH